LNRLQAATAIIILGEEVKHIWKVVFFTIVVRFNVVNYSNNIFLQKNIGCLDPKGMQQFMHKNLSKSQYFSRQYFF
jgi:hypothetical protein